MATFSNRPIADSIGLVELPAGNQFGRVLGWTAGGRLTFDARIGTNSVYGLRLGTQQVGAKLQRLVHNSAFASKPLISPDNRLIAFFGAGGINVMNADGTGERPAGVTGLPLSWVSPDELAFLPSDESGPRIVSITTGMNRSVGHDAPLGADPFSGLTSSETFQYIASTNEVVFRRFVGDRARFIARRAGGEERLILEVSLGSDSREARTQLAYWKLSPAGDRLIYVYGHRRSPADWYDLHLRTVGRDDDRVVGRVSGPLTPQWTTDGRHVVYSAFVAGAAAEYQRFNVETGESVVVLDRRHVDGVLPAEARASLSRCGMATDLSYLVCQAIVNQEHRRAWENVTAESIGKQLGVSKTAGGSTGPLKSRRSDIRRSVAAIPSPDTRGCK